MNEKTNWVYVGSLGRKNISSDILAILDNDLSLECAHLSTISELFPLLSNPNFVADYISIDLNCLNNFVNTNPAIDEYAILNTLNTLISSTVHRNFTGKTSKRTTKLGINIGEDADFFKVKNLLALPEVKFVCLSPIITAKYNIADVEESISSILNGDCKMSKKVHSLVSKSKGTSHNTTGINVTARQQQILSLITERAASNKVIARTLGITESTVKLHMSALLKKYGVRNRTQLAIFARNQITNRSTV